MEIRLVLNNYNIKQFFSNKDDYKQRSQGNQRGFFEWYDPKSASKRR